jgi:hypothetical protein
MTHPLFSREARIRACVEQRSGASTVEPTSAAALVVQPGASNGSVGFCANRNVSGSGVLPFVTSASGKY